MGIAALEIFLETYSVDACYMVEISVLANDYKLQTGKNPKIVVDAETCYEVLYEGVDWLVGYEGKEFTNRLQTFVQNFKKQNIDLAFFLGGVNTDVGKETWLNRRRETIDEVHRAIDHFSILRYLPDISKLNLTNSGLTTAYILKYVLGCEVHMAIDDCREDIIRYAEENECFAILSQNTDFVASQVDAIVLSSKHFALESMSTVHYDRVILAYSLGIQLEELPLLALMTGNGSVPYEKIRVFHELLCRERQCDPTLQFLIPAIAGHIKQLPRNVPIETILIRLAREQFNDVSVAELLKTSYYSYFPIKNSDMGEQNIKNKWSRIQYVAKHRYRCAVLPNIAYTVLSKQIFEDITTLEDLRISPFTPNAFDGDQMTSSTVLRPLRLRLYGVLLAERYGEDTWVPVIVREWCNEIGKSYARPVVVLPIKPRVYHPGLMALWTGGDDINEVRWTLFLSTISPSLNAARWRLFDQGLLLTILSVRCLYDANYLDECELCVILVTIATYPLCAGKLAYLRRCNTINFRATNISITLSGAFGLVLTVLAACGYPVKLSENNAYLKFEGKLFQLKYFDAVEKRADILSLCESNHHCLELFKRMWDLIRGN